MSNLCFILTLLKNYTNIVFNFKHIFKAFRANLDYELAFLFWFSNQEQNNDRP